MQQDSVGKPTDGRNRGEPVTTNGNTSEFSVSEDLTQLGDVHRDRGSVTHHANYPLGGVVHAKECGDGGHDGDASKPPPEVRDVLVSFGREVGDPQSED